jgi:hypothetical protein
MSATSKRDLFISSLAAVFMLGLAMIWIPPVIDAAGDYMTANLWSEFRPRALVGSIVSILQLDRTGYLLLKLVAHGTWLGFVFYLLLQMNRKSVVPEGFGKSYALGMLALIFTFSTVTVMALGPVDLIDSVAFLFVLVAYVILKKEPATVDAIRIVITTALLLSAVLTHEKSVFDLAILATWFLWKQGLRFVTLCFSPAFLLSVIFLVLIGDRTTNNGFPPAQYLDQIASGYAFLRDESFNMWGVLVGGGALWLLYAYFCVHFILQAASRNQRLSRAILVFAMTGLCFLSLVVAHDTNRLLALIWLPLLLTMSEVDIYSLLHKARAQVSLAMLLAVQLAIPPMLVYEHGMVPYNCYALEFAAEYLGPKRVDINRRFRPFHLFVDQRPDVTSKYSARCSL